MNGDKLELILSNVAIQADIWESAMIEIYLSKNTRQINAVAEEASHFLNDSQTELLSELQTQKLELCQ